MALGKYYSTDFGPHGPPKRAPNPSACGDVLGAGGYVGGASGHALPKGPPLGLWPRGKYYRSWDHPILGKWERNGLPRGAQLSRQNSGRTARLNVPKRAQTFPDLNKTLAISPQGSRTLKKSPNRGSQTLNKKPCSKNSLYGMHIGLGVFLAA